ncbi:MAG: thioredoxin domain-containing protein [Candidatus Magasanikbacteria bacterium]|nr:thioredoxin domain-containing protein [Candidatus Magasanikbacteria bacterium]
MTNINPNLNDPDFDRPTNVPQQKSFFEQLAPMSALVVGLVGGMLIICTIGFIIMLTIYFRNGSGGTIAGAGNAIPLAQIQKPSAPSQPTAQAPSGSIPPLTNADHVRGNKNAQLTWIEYSDFECPFCKRFHPSMLQMMQEYGDKIKWVYRHFPLSFHQNSVKEAEATECANELGGNEAFWKYSDAILERTTSNGTGFALEALVPLAKELGLNESKFKNCLDSGKYTAHVQQDETGGQGAGVQGTPGSFLIGKDGKAQFISGAVPYQQIKAAIDAQLR